MDTAAILAKIAGIALFIITARSIYRHFKGAATKKEPPKPNQSAAEHVLNSIMLYAWFIFMTAFSLGMVFNN